MARILVIENELALLGLISSTLRLDGHTIIETNGPVDALSIVTQRRNEIDLALTCVEMEPYSGFEFVKRMAEKRIYIPALFMSGHPNVVGVIASSLGPDAVIDKP